MTHIETVNLLWDVGWLVAVPALYWVATRVPLQVPPGRLRRAWVAIGLPLAVVSITIFANMALTLHDVHFDATVEKAYTPSAKALAVVDGIDRPVRLTYLYQGQDNAGQRAREIVELMGRRNDLLTVQTIDPDKKPSLASSLGAKLYNTAVLESDGRRVTVPTIDETEIAIGIERVLRKQIIAVCFMEGHNEYPVDNFEFHTHLEGVHDHSHGDASSKLIETTGHGVGRLRRALESVGYEVRRITPATQGIPQSCSAVIDANPRNTWLPAEARALSDYLGKGGSALLLFDLGFTLEPRLDALLAEFGVSLQQAVIVDQRDHYGTDPEMVAVTGYDPHPITRSLALTFFPGARPLTVGRPAHGIHTIPIVMSGPLATTRPVPAAEAREIKAGALSIAGDGTPAPRVIAAAAEGRLGSADMRVVICGDADFASNSFLPYMANSDLALSIVRWLVREEKVTPIASRIAAPPIVLLTKGQMRAIFSLAEIAMPLCVLAVGLLLWWRYR